MPVEPLDTPLARLDGEERVLLRKLQIGALPTGELIEGVGGTPTVWQVSPDGGLTQPHVYPELMESPAAVSMLPKGQVVTGINGTDTAWRANGRGGLVKVRD